MEGREGREGREGERLKRYWLLAPALASCFAGRSPPDGQREAARTVTKPISFAILEDYDKGDDLRAIARDFSRFQELGIPEWRGSFGWDDYEPEPGRYDLAWLESFVRLADSMGIRLRPYLGYTPGWAAWGGEDPHDWNDPPRGQDDWARFVSAVAGKLRDYRSIVSYEIYNEENAPLWWEGTADEYAQVLRAGAAAIRKADPDAEILLGGMVWPDPEWLETVCRNGAAFDILPFHAYPETWTPSSIQVENYLGPAFRSSFVPEADQSCGRKPIWINEAGFATVPGKTEREQAEWWARAIPTFLAEPRIEQIGIYEIKDQPLGTAVIGDEPNYHLGLIRRDGTPKPAFQTIKLLIRLLDTDSITVADPLLGVRVTGGRAGQLYRHLFIRPDGGQIVFVWDKSSGPMLDLTLSRPAGRVTAYQADGSGRPWGDTEGRIIRGVRLEPGTVQIFEATAP
jgi:polysaccharide biosynthesis protein PslG